MTRRLYGMLFAVLLMSCTASCDDSPAYDYGDFREAIVTYEGTDGAGSEFTYNVRDDSPLVRLSAEGFGVTGIEEGSRVLIRYTEVERVSPTVAVIRLDGVSQIISDVIRAASAAEIDGYTPARVDVTSLWRSGMYINLDSWVPYSGQRFTMALVADETTLNQPVVEAVLVYDLLGNRPTFERKAYASFDITNVWMRESCRALRVTVTDTTSRQTVYEFRKQ